MFYLTTQMVIWHWTCGIGTIYIARGNCCIHYLGYVFQLADRGILYTPSHRQDTTYHGLCYTSRGVLARTCKGFFYVNHHTYKTIYTEIFVLPVVNTGWNDKWLKGSTMEDRFGDQSQHEQIALQLRYVSLTNYKYII